jgi:hypothetical protein
MPVQECVLPGEGMSVHLEGPRNGAAHLVVFTSGSEAAPMNTSWRQLLGRTHGLPAVLDGALVLPDLPRCIGQHDTALGTVDGPFMHPSVSCLVLGRATRLTASCHGLPAVLPTFGAISRMRSTTQAPSVTVRDLVYLQELICNCFFEL